MPHTNAEMSKSRARTQLKCHPHMLRHSTGYALANKGTDTRTLQAYRVEE
jgi:site-specific recombinase XerD